MSAVYTKVGKVAKIIRDFKLIENGDFAADYSAKFTLK